MTTTCITDEELVAWAHGLVTDDRITSIREHVASCETCRTVAAELVRTDGSRPLAKRVGRYAVTEPIGRGGMGTVFAAWDPTVGRKVAVKVLHEATTDGRSVERFRFERQVLASLEHPHIARLLDAGETEDGRPWFAMDFVDGKPLDLACDDAKLTPRQRVELLLPVLRAVAAAHQLLVVHRDLKPSNILVDRTGAPRLVDFGIARLLEGASGLTQTGVTPMTPAYASPEQVRREPIAVTSDVYSLGVVLYEVLAGVSPYEVAGRDAEALLVAVTRGVTTPPSVAVARASDAAVAARSLSRDGLRAALEGELDAIVMMALRVAPGDRYQSVQALIDDLTAALEGRPTVARRGERAYRAALFVRRNRALVAGVVAAFVALTVGLVATIWQAQQAERERDLAKARFEQVRQLAKAVLFEYHDGIADLPGSTALRERLVKDAQGYLEALSAQANGDEGLEQELANSYLKLGDVQGDPFGASLGDTTAARASYEKGRALAQSILKKQPEDRAARRSLAASAEKLAAIEEVSGNLEVALASYREAVDIDTKLLAEIPEDLDQQFALGRDELATAQLLMQLGKLDDALTYVRHSFELRKNVAATRTDLKTRKAVAASINTIGNIQLEQGHLEQSIASFLESEAIMVALVKEFPESVEAQRGCTVTWTTLSQLYRLTGQNERALESSRKSEAAAREALKRDPDNAVAHRDLAAALHSMSPLLNLLGREPEAQLAQKEALEISRKRRDADPESLLTLRDLLIILDSASQSELQLRHFDEAERLVKEKFATIATIEKAGGGSVNVEEEAAMAHDTLAEIALRRGQFDEALAENQLNIEGLRKIVDAEADLTRVENRMRIGHHVRATILLHRAQKTGRRADWDTALAEARSTLADTQRLVDAKTAVEPLVELVKDTTDVAERCEAALAGKPRAPLALK